MDQWINNEDTTDYRAVLVLGRRKSLIKGGSRENDRIRFRDISVDNSSEEWL